MKQKKLNILQKFLISLIRFYQKYISPDHSIRAKHNGNVPFCKHYPTCSQYSIEAIEKKGALIGGLKSFWRILRCQPWSKGGYDPVEPDKKIKK